MSLHALASGVGCDGGHNPLATAANALTDGRKIADEASATTAGGLPNRAAMGEAEVDELASAISGFGFENEQQLNSALSDFGITNDTYFDELEPFSSVDWNEEMWRDMAIPTAPVNYEFSANNPFQNADNPAAVAADLFNQGLLDQAILAYEAEVTRNPLNSDAWRWLGTAHAENDNDKIAINCLLKSLEADPENIEALLDVGVSYTNELIQVEALNYLKQWLHHHPEYVTIVSEEENRVEPVDALNMMMAKVTRMFMRAADMTPHDPDLHTVLGVLYNLSREFGKAEHHFSIAVQLDPASHSLWNKLGATQANSGRDNGSKDAVYAYRKALELKPNYVRAWVNMGISYANQGKYHTAAKYYLKALSLNPKADHIWSYVRVAFACMDREDLSVLTERRDVNLFRKEFTF